MTPKAAKLLRLALDAGATDGEAQAAACKLIRHWRAEGVTADSLIAPDTARPRNATLPFGMYRGCSIANVADTDPQYLVWVLENCAKLRPGLRRAIVAALERAKP